MSSKVIDSIVDFVRTADNGALASLFVPLLLLAIFFIGQTGLKISSSRKEARQGESYRTISPQPDFNLQDEQPLKLRPFKPKYHLTMALQNTTFSDLLAFDNTYATRLSLRREIMATHPTRVLAAAPRSIDPVAEFYEWIFGTYLPHRFPSIFVLFAPPATKEHTSRGLHCRNKVTGESIPVRAPADPMKALVALGAHMDTDFLFLLPSADDPGKYVLDAYVCCFPSGWAPSEKFGKSLAAIHEPVPGYAQKLELSMDRYFAGLPKRKIVTRANWSVTTDDRLFVEKGNHLHAETVRDAVREKEGMEGDEKGGSPAGDPVDYDGGGLENLDGLQAFDRSLRLAQGMSSSNPRTLDMNMPGLKEEIESQKQSVNVQNCRLRCERQTLHRLPETNGIVFGFKTYLYTIDEIKKEGLGEELADAIEGLGKGSVPEMEFYKRGVVWGEKVAEYLRSKAIAVN